ncbi:erythrocyte membrane protein 1, PfEMP1, putative [Plasmodium sp.]|nr:erythrocyte membrane protein 1, PfEMP1, putative [Plasmodium sp.]
MARPQPSSASSSSDNRTARDILEGFGKKIQEEAAKSAYNYRQYLHANIISATYPKDKNPTNTTPSDPCDLNYQYHTNVSVGSGKDNPCGNISTVRFSDKHGGQCTNKKIRGNDVTTGGACVPFRRLFLCDQNLVYMPREKIKNTHNLLLEVCLAAKHEGKLLVEKYKEYKKHNPHFDSNICTVLARSFADIGDIVRGKDLFIGYNEKDREEKVKLQSSLKKIFKELYINLRDTAVKKYYKDKDDNEENYYKLREDWWALNRKEVWKAITCGAELNDTYSINTGNGMTNWDYKCGNDKNKVPTNLDYVPQYLRWFDEWSEDFCRKRKKRLENAIEKCRRDEDGKPKYCTLNGYDCAQTVRAQEIYSMDYDCTKCSVACDPFVHWIDNQKLEFKKQKEKYTKEIEETHKITKETSNGKINNIYAKEFYQNLKQAYGGVDKFLELLNKARACQDQPGLKNKTSIDFKDKTDDMFSRTEYCQACPWCGVQWENGKWTAKNDEDCKYINATPTDGPNTSYISILSTEKQEETILEKLKKFCKGNEENNDHWKCYYNNNSDNSVNSDNCILQNQKQNTKDKTIMSYYTLFSLWLKEMLDDSIEWRTELKNCINNNSSKCIKGCKNNCDCYIKWVKKKAEEWKQIKKHFHKQSGLIDDYHFSILETFLEDQFLPSIEEAYGNDEAIETIEEFLEEQSTHKDSELKDKKDAIDFLLKHELEEADICIKNNPKEDTTCIDENELQHNNPCATPGNKRVVSVKDIATQMQREARKQLLTRGSKDELKADAKLGQYINHGNVDDIKNGGICKITPNHSNRNNKYSQYPCYGKNDQRFVIGKIWSEDDKEKTTYRDVFLPQRREHMCTSNLEHLMTDSQGLSNNKNTRHSLLGDVLVAAKYEGHFIVDNIKSSKDKSEICRVMRNSFADIGDIIRGRDLWIGNNGEQTTQGKLKEIFGTIFNSLDENIKEKYERDPDYKQLREDWWAANRIKVWSAMKCALKGDEKVQCRVTPDDYIPQRLRWMTEWAEWYCKKQSQEYQTLQGECRGCIHKSKNKKCMKDTQECTSCKRACDVYKKEIEPWKKQWRKLERQYRKLFLKARIAAFYGSRDYYIGDVQEKDKPVYNFLYDLHVQNGGILGTLSDTFSKNTKRAVTSTNTTYDNVGAYLHVTGDFSNCQSQTKFCNSRGKDDTNYAFRNTPQVYDAVLNCVDKEKKTQKKKGEDDEVCEMVKDILKENNGMKPVGECKPKNNGKGYPNWECGNKNLVQDKRVCMPPRRQKLCLYYLAHNSQTEKIKTKGDLKNAFIKCAAAEIFHSWHYYKSKNVNGNYLDEQLKKGKIPEEFLQSMFYTYADYRDICLDTDISNKVGDVNDAKNKIDEIFSKQDDEGVYQEREEFWEKMSPAIWKGMLCGLSHASVNKEIVRKKLSAPKSDNDYYIIKRTLEDFEETPQFLRWFIEWGEDFCKQQKKELMTLQNACPERTCSKEATKQNCEEQCKAYKLWLKDWKDQYKTQSEKYTRDKENGEYRDVTDIARSAHAYQYFHSQLRYLCDNKVCKCMKDPSKESKEQSDGNTDSMPASLDPIPEDYKDKCECKKKAPEKDVLKQENNACTIVEKLFIDESAKNFKEACALKYGKGKYAGWNCNSYTSKTDKDDGALCIPPRRQKLYLKYLQELTDGTSPEALRQAFVQCAAVETFFLWHKYKRDIENEKEKENVAHSLPLQKEPSTEDSQIKLNGGIIPDDFKRQMFYTFGDYRDILFGKNIDNGNNMDAVKTNIDRFFPNGAQNPNEDKNGDNEREEWWQNHAEAIWKGMLCALTYKNDAQTVNPELNIQLTKKNDYKTVTISSVGPNNGIQLEEFSRRPIFFRWLEEWGEEFCRKRTDKFKKLDKECRGVNNSGNPKYCSGDGYHCNDNNLTHNNMFTRLNCGDCEKECTNYRKWIQKKVQEFDKHKNKYGNEIEKLKTDSSKNAHDKMLYELINEKNNYTCAEEFLASLNNCKNGEHDKNQTNKIDFKNLHKTFGPSKYCKACPLSGVNCDGKDGCITNREKNLTHQGGESTYIDILINDGATKETNNELQEKCKEYGLYKNLKKQKWKCQNINDIYKCQRQNPLNSEYYDDNIPFKILFERWLRDFVEGYNKSKERITRCTNDKTSCKQGCKGNCVCVEEWLKIKEEEWGKIKNYYKKYFEDDVEPIDSNIKGFFEHGTFSSDAEEAKKVVDEENKRDELWGCTGRNYCESKEEREKYGDFITNLISKLKQKITSCPYEPGQPQPNCVENPSPDDEEENIEDTPTTDDSQSPKFCPKDVEDTKDPETDSEKLCDDKNQAKCNDFQKYTNNTCEPKKKLIGLGAHNIKASPRSNIYISPRVQQLCREPLKELADRTKNAEHVTEEQFSKALQECAYNEAKTLYEYYKGEGKESIPINNNVEIEDNIKQHTLEAMKRSYADYGNIVKDDMLWIYPHRRYIDTVIISVADKFNKKSKVPSVYIDVDAKRLNLWKYVRTRVWKSMLCGYEDAVGGDINSLGNGDDLCMLPTIDSENQFSRWFVEWGENFSIRREQELKRLKEKCKSDTCDSTDEGKKRECKSLCENYKQFLKNYENQYEKQSILYNELKPSISEFQKKNPFTFLKEKCNSKYSCFENKDENDVSKIFEYPSDEIKNLCICTSTEKPKIKLTNCIEEAAYELQQDVSNKIGNNSSILNGKKNFLFECRKGDLIVVHNNSDYTKKNDKDKLEQLFPSNRYSYEHKGTINVHVGEEWDCNKTNINFREEYLCLPPRRRFICLKKIDDKISSTVDDKDKLLELVMDVAKTEGVRILKNYEEQENKTDFSELCDDMKYSFADLGDIIRGKDLWRSNGEQQRIQHKLKTIFRYINDHLVKQNVTKYQNDGGNYYTLRSDWWHANRKDIWKAMTCNAPNVAKLYKNEPRTTNILHGNCDHNNDPPYVDYIPQKLRWMTEWSEYFCNTLNKKLDTFKIVCNECTETDEKCRDNNKGSKCQKCKEECEKYKDFVNKWKLQYVLQSKAYEELYKKIDDDTSNYISDDDKYVIQFLKQAKETCGSDDPSTSEKYLYKTSNCKQYKFNDESTHSNKIYAFNEQPKGYESKCTCEITQHPLDDCPDDINKEVCTKFEVIKRCKKKNFNNDLDNWNSYYVEDFKGKRAGVLIPPRRRHLCLNNTIIKLRSMRHKEDFKKEFLNSVYTESKFLWDKYNKNSKDVMKAMKYNFADYADIIKGTDILDTTTTKNINNRLAQLLKESSYSPKNVDSWWKKNKKQVWYAMLCGYRDSGGKITNADCNTPNEEYTDQFLRWFQEWIETFCTERQILYNMVKTRCNNVTCDNVTGKIDSKCIEACKNYSNFILLKRNVYQSLKKQYNDNYKSTKADNKEPHEYFKEKCKDDKCACFNEKLNVEDNWKTPYETLDDYELKKKCDCQKLLPPSDESILHTTVPFGVALALGSIAFLFLKKKSKSSVDLLRVLNIPKGEYGMPTLESKNRYIPYRSGTYKGKTYIYMEGDTSGDEDKYIGDITSSDITSSESEYEELDINDIYVPGSPKYKTLIEVVLEPSKNGANTPSKGDSNPLGNDTPLATTPLTDEEWNELKNDFISQYVVSEPLDVAQYDVSTELPMNILGNVLDDGINEKPFITSIHDRDLYTGEEISYNIHMSSNSMDDPKYVSNNVYSGIDLINDTLSGNKHIDIYDEVLKRKENELFGMNHMKNTSNNSIAKLTNSDPIMNQLDLLHKWLDRHRDMCDKWNTKEELLDKLNEQWNKDNNVGDIRNDNKTLNTDVTIEIDMDETKGKKEFSNMDTILDNIEDDIYYDVNDENPSMDDIPMDHNKVDVPKKVHVEMKIHNNKSNGSLEPEFPISDVWNI